MGQTASVDNLPPARSVDNLPASSNVVGIDLGTTFSSVAVYKHGKPEVIPNKHGFRLTPSVVYYDPQNTDVSVGKYAENWALNLRSNFVYDTKRLMGRKYDDVYVQDLIKKDRYTYKIVKGKEENVAIEVRQDNKTVQKFPEEVGSEILKYLKDCASQYLGVPVTEAVISVPAHFSNAQRKATKKAAELAGLKVLKLISEPVAAAIYYTMDKPRTNSTLLLFDIGGGTSDVSVVDVDSEEFKVKGLEGDSYLGGGDFDNNLMNHFFPRDLRNGKAEDNNRNDIRHLIRLRKKCTKIKTMLSDKEETALDLDHFGRHRDNSLPLIITRKKFESLNETMFNRLMDLITQCLDDLNLTKRHIDHVILVGGSSRIPKIRSLTGSYFGVDKLKTDVNPDEAIALGAAIQAAVLSTNGNKELEMYKVTEVTPLCIGTSLIGERMKVGIPKNTPLPAKCTIETVTSRNDQKSLSTKIYEGERKNCKFNTLLGELVLENIPPGKAGSVEIETIFNLDEDGILTVESYTKCDGQKSKAVITLKEYRLSEYKMKNIFADVKRFRQEDEFFVKFMLYLDMSMRFCDHILYDLNNIINCETQSTVKKLCNDFLERWENAQYTDPSVSKLEDLKTSFQTFKRAVEPLIRHLITVEDHTPKDV